MAMHMPRQLKPAVAKGVVPKQVAFFGKSLLLEGNLQTQVRLGAHSVRWREENSVEQFALQVTDVSVPGWK
jgi:hypothetical protein